MKINTYTKTIILFISLCAVLFLSACSSKVSYEDAGDVETVTTAFGSTDLQQSSITLVDSLLTTEHIVSLLKGKRPVLFIDGIKNKTSEHIDTESITDTISTKLISTGKFRFIDMTKVESVKKQYDYQNKSGLVNEETSVKVGRQIGADYMLYGNISSIVKRAKSTKDIYMKITLKLMDIESGIIEWQGEKEIRKQNNKTFLGL
jgi:uncharacterized protein (TIGR02722 family)